LGGLFGAKNPVKYGVFAPGGGAQNRRKTQIRSQKVEPNGHVWGKKAKTHCGFGFDAPKTL